METGSWAWTLNWDPVLLREDGSVKVMIGSCPRSPDDVSRLAKEAGVSAILCLQSDECLDSLGIDIASLKERCRDERILHVRVPVRDFDKNDQSCMLPEAVRVLQALLQLEHTVYVHCTAGINRAPLAVVGLLTFAQGVSPAEAVEAVKAAREKANPYMESLYSAKARLLHGHNDELTDLSRRRYEERKARGDASNRNDWYDAEDEVISRFFRRRAAADAELLSGHEELLALHGKVRGGPSEEETRLAASLAAARDAAEGAEASAQAELAKLREESARLLAAEREASAAEAARLRRLHSEAQLSAAAAADEAAAAARLALAQAAERAAQELDKLAEEAAQEQARAARSVRAALDAAEMSAKASAARQGVLEAEVRRLADASAATGRLDYEAQRSKSDLELSFVAAAAQAAAEVQRGRAQVEELRREVLSLRDQLLQAQTRGVLLEGLREAREAEAHLQELKAELSHTG